MNNLAPRDQTVTVSRAMLVAIFAVTWVAVWLTAGLGSALASRVGASSGLMNPIAFGIAGAVMYPYFALRAEMKGGKLAAPFWKWALVWMASAFLGHYVISPLVLRVIP